MEKGVFSIKMLGKLDPILQYTQQLSQNGLKTGMQDMKQ